MEAPGLISPRSQAPQLACEFLPHWGLPSISAFADPLPSCSPWFQILNTSQELKEADLEYLEVRRHMVLGCHPIPALTIRLGDWNSWNS